MANLRAATPWFFLVLALVSSVLLIWTTPPFMMADELVHLQRADALTFGPTAFRSRTVGDERYVKAENHLAIIDAAAPFERLKFHAEQKVRATDLAAAAAPWLDARRLEIFPGQAMNPVLYVPSAAAVAWGRHFGWTVLDTLYLARVFNALASIALGFAALWIARQAQLPIFTLLMLPMSVGLFAAVTQDGPLIGLAALTVAVLSRAMGQGRPLAQWELWAAAAGIAMLGIGKPPYAAMALLLLAVPAAQRGMRWVAGGLALAVPLAWNAWLTLAGAAAPPPPGWLADPSGQVRHLRDHVADLPAIVGETFRVLGEEHLKQFVGVLGWQDTPLPDAFYPFAWAALALALAASVAVGLPREWRLVRLAAPLVVLVAAAGVFAALYISWSPVGSPRIEGVQGRYFIPLAMFLALVIEGPRPLLGRAEDVARALVLAFPLVSLVVTELALIHRFYLQ